MSKEYTHIKANGIRNELKDIRKAVDKLTEALIEIHLAQTSKHEQNTKECVCGREDDLVDGFNYDYD